MQYLTIDSLSTAISFGDLTVARAALSGTSNGSIGVFGGGRNASFSSQNVIDYITIATPGNATDFGDLLAAIDGTAACAGD